TDTLIPFLAAANRAGYVTTFSQPGWPAGTNGQRAAVDGFGDDELAGRIEHGLAATDLVVLTRTPWTAEGPRVPVTLARGDSFTWVGDPATEEEITYDFGEVCGEAAVRALLRAQQICVFDPVWGRDDLLWPELAKVIGIVGQ